MKKRYPITASQAQLAREAMSEIKDLRVYQRLEVIALLGEGYSESEVAQITRFSIHTIPLLRRKFVHHGMDSLMNHHKGRPAQIGNEETQAFLARYTQASQKAEILTVKSMWLDFQQQFDSTMTLQAFYRLLKRHHWRKIRPRPEHPNKASLEEIEASKKLSPHFKRY